MNFLKLLKTELDINAINDLVAHESCGAISLFIGTTRDNFDNKKVISLEYEAYEPMAMKSLNGICGDVRSKWPDIKNIAIYHRLGLVPVKQSSVVIAISSPHRQDSLEAVQYTIDELKKNVPIWKKELYDNEEADRKDIDSKPIRKRSKLNFDMCLVKASEIPKNLIQINADKEELSRRMSCFIVKKREEIDLYNAIDFIQKKATTQNDNSDSCARVNSIAIKEKDFRGHFKTHRVKNELGPQIKPDYMGTLDKLNNSNTLNGLSMKTADRETIINIPQGISERIDNVEEYLKLESNNMKDIYRRLKNIEDRIIFLEGSSPEYCHFLGNSNICTTEKQKKNYTIEEIDNLIEQLSQNIKKETAST